MDTKLKPEVKANWLAALRGGEYKQGQQRLHYIDEDDTERFCCLGVLCDLAAENGVKMKKYYCDDEFYWEYDGGYEVLPQQVVDWAFADAGNENLRNPHTSTGSSVADLNDNGCSFAEIADLIEKDF